MRPIEALEDVQLGALHIQAPEVYMVNANRVEDCAQRRAANDVFSRTIGTAATAICISLVVRKLKAQLTGACTEGRLETIRCRAAHYELRETERISLDEQAAPPEKPFEEDGIRVKHGTLHCPRFDEVSFTAIAIKIGFWTKEASVGLLNVREPSIVAILLVVRILLNTRVRRILREKRGNAVLVIVRCCLKNGTGRLVEHQRPRLFEESRRLRSSRTRREPLCGSD